jgi:hypothetical protein
MARMLGRYESPGCCPGRRSGWTRNRKLFSLDCAGGTTDKRWAKRVEQRAVAREIARAMHDLTGSDP